MLILGWSETKAGGGTSGFLCMQVLLELFIKNSQKCAKLRHVVSVTLIEAANGSPYYKVFQI